MTRKHDRGDISTYPKVDSYRGHTIRRLGLDTFVVEEHDYTQTPFSGEYSSAGAAYSMIDECAGTPNRAQPYSFTCAYVEAMEESWRERRDAVNEAAEIAKAHSEEPLP